jgi:hypothetical protein
MDVAVSRPIVVGARGRGSARTSRLALALGTALVAAVLGLASISSDHQPGRSLQRQGAAWAKLPAAARDVISRDLGKSEPQFLVKPGGAAGLIAHGAGFSATFSRGGAQVTGPSGTSLHLGLEAIGRGRNLESVSSVTPSSHANVVTYGRAGLVEQYANGPLGLEQSFAINRRTGGTGELTLVVGRVPAGERAIATAGDLGVSITSAGRGVLRYADLSVIDSRAHRIPARIAISHGKIILRVEDSSARYPLRIDPNLATSGAILSASQYYAHDNFGESVAMSSDGHTIAVGAPYDPPFTDAPQASPGIVYVFSEPASGGWQSATQTAELTASDRAPGDNFGESVAISGDGSTVVVGAPARASNDGAVYVFTKPTSGGWQDATESAELTRSTPSADALGYSVAVSTDGSVIVAGAPGDSFPAVGGAGYVFSEASTGGWQNATQTAVLSASTSTDDNIGSSVAMAGDGKTVAIVGSPPGNTGGHVYVFGKPASGGWQDDTSPMAALTVSDPSNDLLAGPLAMSADGKTIVAGRTFVFSQPSNGWQNATQSAALTVDGEPAYEGLRSWHDGVAISSDGTEVALGVPALLGGNVWARTTGAADVFAEPASGTWQDTDQTASVGTVSYQGSPYDGTYSTDGVAMSGDGGTIATGIQDGSTVTVYPPLPAAALPPTVSGIAVQGHTLTETNGTWSGNATAYSHQWEDCDSSGSNCVPIEGATGQSYTVQDVDAGSTIEVQETASNIGGAGNPASSAPTALVQPLSATSLPAITGQPLQGRTLTETNAAWNTNVDGYLYQWQRCHGADNCSDIDGANDQSYTLTNADAGYTIEVEEDAYNDGGYGIPASSHPTAVVVPLVPTSSQAPTITGTAVEGNALTASAVTWTNTPTSTSYQWEDCDSAGQNCSAISGATAKSYTLAATDIAKRVLVEETATNAGGTSAPVTSAATGAVPESGPVGLEIDNGDYATNNPNVTVQAVWPVGTKSILISNNGGFRTDAQTVAPASTITWKLEQTGNDRLPKTVYLRFLGVGQDDINFTDDIILDETAPTIQSASVSGAGASRARAARAHRARGYRLHLKATDKLVGLCEVAVSGKRSSRSADLLPLASCKKRGLVRVSRAFAVKLSSTPRYVRALNSAGDWSGWFAIKT